MKRFIGLSRRGRGHIGGLVVLTLMLAPAAAQAATITVDSAVDNTTGCTLRNAITAANTNTAQGTCPAGEAAPAVDVINFSLPLPATITLGSALPDISEDVTIAGPGMNQLTIDGADSYHLITTISGATISISGLTMTNAHCGICGPGVAAGGAIHNAATLTLTDVALTNNTASANGNGTEAVVSAEGGAIRNLGQLTIVQSKLTGNTAEATGATSQASALGGAIMNYGTLTVDRTTLDSNAATASGGLNTNPNGGAIENYGTVSISRSTISNNTASGSGASSGNGAFGGGMSNASSSAVNVTIDRSTFAGNIADDSGDQNGEGGGLLAGTGAFEITSSTFAHNSAYSASNILGFAPDFHIKNTIVANPEGTNPATGVTNCAPHLASDGYNLSDDSSCGFTSPGDQENADPMLGPLAANGGPTKTYAPSLAGDAIDQGKSSTGEAVDQRGRQRPWDFPDIVNPVGGDGTDVGAFELQDTTPPDTVIDSGPTAVTNDPTPTFTFHSTEAGSTFKCDTEGPYGFTPCTSPKTTQHLADGPHTFAVFARDLAGNVDPSPATRSFTVKTAEVKRSGSTLTITAAPGAKDNFLIKRVSPTQIQVTDFAAGAYSGSGIHTGPGCAQSGDYTANCSSSPITAINVVSGAGNDRVRNMTALKSFINGGGGNDALIGGTLGDQLTGGPGADTFQGGNGNDVLLAHDLASDSAINCDGGTKPGGADQATLDKLPKDAHVFGCEIQSRH